MLDQDILKEMAQYFRDHNIMPIPIEEFARYSCGHTDSYHNYDHRPFRYDFSLTDMLNERIQKAVPYPESKFHAHIKLCEKQN
jgi:hypothetical protein